MDFNNLLNPLICGAVAGLSVDVSLYPIDTIKTRLQSKDSFFKSGGFKRLYSGIGSVIVGSTPGAAVFFVGYEFVKHNLRNVSHHTTTETVCVNMVAASVGEILACFVRVPIEVIKQRSQVSSQMRSLNVFYKCVQEEGFLGLYRGYRSTVLREIPFSVIQFPLWEFFKASIAKNQPNNKISSWESAWCGFFAGGIAGAMTTPLDVAKTRIMLAQKEDITAKGNILPVLYNIWTNEGYRSLFAGILPRALFISVGGFVFLGVYDFMSGIVKIEK